MVTLLFVSTTRQRAVLLSYNLDLAMYYCLDLECLPKLELAGRSLGHWRVCTQKRFWAPSLLLSLSSLLLDHEVNEFALLWASCHRSKATGQ
jgi:hypothetical protein